MSILFGHPTGNPNSHHAALAHFERGRLEAFAVPWMPSSSTLQILGRIPPLSGNASRLARRRFEPLAQAPKIQGRCGELHRLLARMRGKSDEGMSYEANDWLMRTMKRECRRPAVTAVHSYEDCSLWQFEEAKRLGKACIYDMPIGYYPAWEETQASLAHEYADWLPPQGLPSSRWVRPEQKRKEMELADLVLAPSGFVRKTVMQFVEKKVALAPYGVDPNFWRPDGVSGETPSLRFIYAGQCSLRKGIPVLLQAWKAAAIQGAILELVGSWQFSDVKRGELDESVKLNGPVPAEKLRERYQAADVFVFPSFFEGFGLVILEAVACGLPVIASDATAGVDILDETTGRLFAAGDLDGLVESLRWFADHRDRLPAMRRAARAKAETYTWENYRRCVSEAVEPFI